MAQRDKLFSKRYEKIIEDEQNNKEDKFLSNFTWDVKRDLTRIMISFNEPIKIQNGRYDKKKSEIPLFEYADYIIEELVGFSYFNGFAYNYSDDFNREALKNLYTPHLLDIIEIQYSLLSKNEQKEYRNQLNEVLSDNNCPWILSEYGQLIKIDSRQFEQDIKNKLLNDLSVLKTDDKKFQSAYDELLSAITFLSNGEYAEAINNAEKAYESVIKIACGIDKGAANDLSCKFLEIFNVLLPDGMNKEGFKANVLMSLPYIRNNSGASHGNGANKIEITKELSNLAINLSCSLCTFVLDTYRKSKAKDEKAEQES